MIESTYKINGSFYIRKNDESTIPARVIYLDTETKSEKIGEEERLRMYMAWTCYQEQSEKGDIKFESWNYHDKSRKLCKYIEDHAYEKTVLWIIGHNIFFDLQASDFFHYFTRWGWILNFVYDGGLTFILVIHKDKKKIKIVSSTNYF